MGAHLECADLTEARLEGADIGQGYLQQADLSWARFQEGSLFQAQLKGAILRWVRLDRVDLRGANLENADLCHAALGGAYLENVILCSKEHHGPLLADVEWMNVNLAIVDWSQGMILGDEQKAKQKEINGKKKTREQQILNYESAVRATRQLAVVLQNQGLNEEAANFAYRAQVHQKTVFWLQMTQKTKSLMNLGLHTWNKRLVYRIQKSNIWLFSWFLYLLAGYGYKLGRSFLAYLFVIIGFATSYYLLGLHDVVGPHHVFGPYHLTWYEAIVVSMTAFHGRGFFANQFQPGDPQAFVAALEAFVGLVIEVTFISTLTRRLFGQ